MMVFSIVFIVLVFVSFIFVGLDSYDIMKSFDKEKIKKGERKNENLH